MFIKQCKGKDLNKVPSSKLEDIFISSTKYDGHYVQIHKSNGSIRFFTSGGKEFYHSKAANELLDNLPDYDVSFEAEFIAGTDGKLGNRGKAAKLTTYRTNFEKGLSNGDIENEDTFKVFDLISCNREFKDRLIILKSMVFSEHIQLVEFSEPMRLFEIKLLSGTMIASGFEGLFLKSPTHLYKSGKRVNDAIKLKLRPTADLLCIGINPGEGKYEGMIGSLILKDSKGRTVSVGAGLDDNDRAGLHAYYTGRVIEIEYEQILDTYIQPTFKSIRVDKTEEEID